MQVVILQDYKDFHVTNKNLSSHNQNPSIRLLKSHGRMEWSGLAPPQDKSSHV